MTFSFEQSQDERLDIHILRYERTPIGDYHDDNWLNGQASIRVGGFQGNVNFDVLTDELVDFHLRLQVLYEKLQGDVEFVPMEEQLILRFIGDGLGHIRISGEVVNEPGVGNRLRFALQIDQTQLAASIRALERIISAYPVRRA